MRARWIVHACDLAGSSLPPSERCFGVAAVVPLCAAPVCRRGRSAPVCGPLADVREGTARVACRAGSAPLVGKGVVSNRRRARRGVTGERGVVGEVCEARWLTHATPGEPPPAAEGRCGGCKAAVGKE